jgi:transcription elongation GreA/GreB family factor
MTKRTLLQSLIALMDEKITHLQQDLSDLQTAIAEDSKSSAGDKYETSREMSQQEIDKIGTQLAEQKRLRNTAKSMLALPESKSVQAGALVQTTTAYLLIGLPVGKIDSEATIFGIGAAAPLAQQLMGKKINDTLVFQQQTIQILSIE